MRPTATEILSTDLVRFHTKEALNLPKNELKGVFKRETVKIGPLVNIKSTMRGKIIDKLKQKTSIKCIEIRTQQTFTEKKAVKIITNFLDPFE